MMPADFSDDTARFVSRSVIKVSYFEATPYLPHSARLTPNFDQSLTSYKEGPTGIRQDFEVIRQHIGGVSKPRIQPVSFRCEFLS